MLYLFFDETYRDLDHQTRFAVSCVGMPREAWLRHSKDVVVLAHVARKKVLHQAIELLTKMGGTASLVYADVPNHLIPPGKQDVFLEVPYINRRNAIWVRLVITSTAPVVGGFDRSNIPLSTLCLFYESKTLASNHRDLFESFIKYKIPIVRKEQLIKRKLQRREISIGRIAETEKAKDFDKSSPEQLGTLLAHHICANVDYLISGPKTDKIDVLNVSNIILKPYLK